MTSFQYVRISVPFLAFYETVVDCCRLFANAQGGAEEQERGVYVNLCFVSLALSGINGLCFGYRQLCQHYVQDGNRWSFPKEVMKINSISSSDTLLDSFR